MRLTVLFAVTLFVSAALLFSVQPMVGKMILPSLGGPPAVWNTCMLFFQAALLGGYAYAHASTRALGPRRQPVLHLLLMLVPLLVLPIALGEATPPSGQGDPVFWLLGRLVVVVGVPFFVVAAGAPLLQRWFAATSHRAAGDPYFLYATSNAGSLLALLSYPLLIEPNLTLRAQSRLWSVGYVVLIGLTVACAAAVWRYPRTAADPDGGAHASARTLKWSQRLWWLALAFVPSSLMLGVTEHITTNLAPVPLLWVIPLAIYLLSFVLVFARRPPISHTLMRRLLPWWALVTAPLFRFVPPGMELQILMAHLVILFLAAMVAHGELARTRPAAVHLTEFYLWVAIGGVLGGAFNALVAPVLFDAVIEYPLAVFLSLVVWAMARPVTEKPDRRARASDVLWPAAFGLMLLPLTIVMRGGALRDSVQAMVIVYVLALAAGVAFARRPLRFALGYGVAVVALFANLPVGVGRVVFAERNFFGVKRVIRSPDGAIRRFFHGTTLHGSQQIGGPHELEPLAYYHRSGPVGDVFRALGDPEHAPRVGVVGLGVGTLAAYAQPGQHIVFYEIDPAVARIARDERFFTYLAKCRGTYEIVLGDGRRSLRDAPDGAFNILFIDAYSSDALPMHMLTREAMALYVRKLAPGGVLLFNVANRYLEIEREVAALMRDAGLPAATWAETEKDIPPTAPEGVKPAHMMVAARRPEDLAVLIEDPRWRPPADRMDTPIWTDQYSSLFGLMSRSR
jgi:SAM-dependent methyltransferase